MLTIALNKLPSMFKHRFLDSADTVLRLNRHRRAMNITSRKRGMRCHVLEILPFLFNQKPLFSHIEMLSGTQCWM